ncbi:MHYT domain-containing protein [Plantactinospora siamensis]|uniref:MHYT domain-containing protein n=1 Tax=Plantactinospora siamensis TaxID=555372 RepID=A0ABV6P2R3_9ACTN
MNGTAGTVGVPDSFRRGPMAHVNHFAYGWSTPVLSYALSVFGSLLGLICAIRLRSASTARQRMWWLALASFALGGTAIWSMHFMAMLGFAVTGTTLRYDVGLTLASAVIAVVAVGVGLAVVGGRAAPVRLAAGGLITGLGVAGMHYTGMAAMRLNGDIDYDPLRVVLSVLIAVVAATAAFWLALTVRRPLAIAGSALVMGVAVSGMHYTGMTAMSVHLRSTAPPTEGATVGTLLVPIVLAVIVVGLGLAYALMLAPSPEDRAGLAYLDERQTARAGDPAARHGEQAAFDPVGLAGRDAFGPRPGRSRPDRVER